MKKIFLTILIIDLNFLMANGGGVFIGYGNYSRQGSMSGLLIGAYGDLDLNPYGWKVSPIINFCYGNYQGISVSDISPSIAIKYYDPKFKIPSFIGFGVEIHFLTASLSGLGLSANHQGLRCLGGIVPKISKGLSMPVEGSFGIIFAEGIISNFTITIGLGINR